MSHNTLNSLSPDEKITVWLVEDNEGFRTNIRDLINETEGLTCVLAVQSCEDALAISTATPHPMFS
jgi:hypothetical protein